MKKLLLATAMVAALVAPAAAADVDLIRGKVRHENGFTRITLGIKNNTPAMITSASVERGFYRGDELVDSGSETVFNPKPDQIGYGDALGEGEDITHIDCRIYDVTP
jgi:opacity protein-like surface antigen